MLPRLASALIGLLLAGPLLAQAPAKSFIDYFRPIPPQGPLSGEAWGAPNVLPRDPRNGLEDTANKYCYWDGQIIKGMVEMVGHNGVWPCYVRPIILRGYGEAGVNPFNSPTEVYIINYPWGKYLGGEQEGCDVCVSSWTRLAPNTLPAMAKAGANYMKIGRASCRERV